MEKTGLLLLLFLTSFWGMAQGQMVTGEVTDQEKNPIPGVTVVIKGTGDGTITNFDGEYSISTDEETVILVYSFLGMRSQEVEVNGQTQINIILEEDVAGLDELVVVGYGTQRKESVVAAISTISAAELVQSPTANLTTGLAGKMPGLTIMLKDGELGAENVQTFIRGQATVNNASPLVLVDGIEREMNTLDPFDIESVSILKDASATAVFGVRGANGVILVTSKKGVSGKPQVTANVSYATQTPTRLPKPMNAVDYMTTRNGVIQQHNEATGQNTTLPYSDEVFDHYRNGYMPEYYVDRNFFEELMNKYVGMTKANVNIRGGNKKTKYFTSMGYMQQGGPFKTERWDEYNYDNEQKLNRFTYRANIDMQITKSLKAWLNLSGYLQDKNDPIIFGANAASASEGSYYYLQMAAYTDIPSISYPDLNSEGNVVSVPGATRTPYGNLNRTGYRVGTNNTINSTMGLELDLGKITKGLSVRGIVAYDAKATHIRGYRRQYQTYVATLDTTGTEDVLSYAPGAGEDTELQSTLTQHFSTNFDLEASLNYSRKFKNAHNVSGLLLYKQNQRIIDRAVPYNYVGIVGRGTYSYKQKYLAEFNFGMNGSEQFAQGRRFGFFPSGSVGWVLSEESFLKGSNAIDFLKIRASFGQVGNDKISNQRFIYMQDWTQGNGNYFQGLGDLPGLPNPVYENNMANEFVTWEKSNKANVGLETNFLNGFEIDLDFFYEKRSSILITTMPIPTYMFGQVKLPPANDGVMTNKGFEATLGYSKSITKDLFLSARVSSSFARNNMESMNETPYDDTFAYPYRVEGQRRGTLWGYDNVGYFKDQADIDASADHTGLGAEVMPGDLKYRDVNGDGEISEKDYVPMKYPNVPELNTTFSLSANYKGFDCSVLLHAVNNYSYNTSGRSVYDWDGNAYGGIKNYFDHHRDAWTEEKAANGGNIRYPRMHPDGNSVSKQPSNYWIIDMNYLRLRNLEFGYTLPKNVTSAINIDKVRFYFNGLNLFTWDNMPYDNLDPEVNNSLSHPIFATYNFGMNITF